MINLSTYLNESQLKCDEYYYIISKNDDISNIFFLYPAHVSNITFK